MERHTRSYLQLMKPGITLSNTLTAVAGFFLAASIVPFSLAALIGGVVGTALVIASACVLNNIIDRDIDTRMKRTAKRELAKGTINYRYALVFSIVLGVLGFVLLLTLTNLLTAFLGLLAYVWYVVIYGVAKRTTSLSTLIGGVPGALPPVAGYTALTGTFDTAALVLFLILFFWQIPHFYAISMFRKDDYASARLPVWAVRFGLKKTKLHILISIVLFAATVPLLTLFGYTGVVYTAGATAIALYWLYKAIVLYKKVDDVKWARTMFGISLMTLLVMIALISVGGFLV